MALSPQANPPPLRLAERGTRLLAASIDELILLALSLPMIFGALPGLSAMAEGGADLQELDVSQVVNAMLRGPGTLITAVALIAWCVITAWLVARNGQTIGKRMLGIKVVRTNGSTASLARILLLRNVVNGLPMLLPTLGLLYQLVDPLFIFQPSRKCLHDLIADTIVIQCEPGPRRSGS